MPFDVPRGDALQVRLTSVLEVLYLMFNEGYAASAGAEWMRPALCAYDALMQAAPSPVVALNHAVAVAMAFGPAAALELVDALRDAPELASYHLLPAVRGDLLCKLGRLDEARAEFERAADLADNARERALLQARARECCATVAAPAAMPRDR